MVTKNTMENILSFNVWINGEAFRGFFVKNNKSGRLADHLWDKYVEHRYDLLKFYAHLDTGNRKMLIKMINEFNRLGKSGFLKKYM